LLRVPTLLSGIVGQQKGYIELYEETKTTVTHPVENVCPPPLRITNGDCAVFCFSMRSAAVLSGVSPEFIF